MTNTIRSVDAVFEEKKADAERLAARFPYREYALSDKDGSLHVSSPDGTSFVMPKDAIEYYSSLGLSDLPGDGLLPKIGEAQKTDDIVRASTILHEVMREFATVEFHPEKFSFVAHLLSADGTSVKSVSAAYFAFSDGTYESLDDAEKRAYFNALKYCLSYYKFLLGLLASTSN